MQGPSHDARAYSHLYQASRLIDIQNAPGQLDRGRCNGATYGAVRL